MREIDPDKAVGSWKGLVASRWTLVDRFESDGRRYVVARSNDVAVHGLEALTVRERQAVAFAALGHSNKLIAYDMGIAASTVSVLLHRAATKLRARNRTEMIAEYRQAISRAPDLKQEQS